MLNDKLAAFLFDELLHVPENNRNDETNLYEFGLDSLKLMRLIVFIEELFNISLKDEDVISENMNSVKSIYTMLNQYGVSYE